MSDLRRIPELWRRLDVTVRDLPLGLLLAVASFLPMLHGHETQVGDLPPRPFDAVAMVALGLQCFPLAVRRRWPALSLGLVMLGFLIAELGSYHMVASSAVPVALISAGAHLERHRRATLVVLTVAYAGLAVVLTGFGSPEGVSGFVTFYLLLAVAWGLGSWVRSNRVAEVERRRRVAEDTRTAERARIARELHDVVTHHVTAMVVQAEASRYLTASPERLDATLATVIDTGRHALTDLRHLLDLLAPDHGDAGAGSVTSGDESRMPPVGELRALVEQTRRAGQPVEFDEQGTPPLTVGSADLVAYRVVQEALTNALKYANGSRTEVQVRHGEREITVRVRTDSASSGKGFPEGSGRGLAGLAARVDVLGGDFGAGPDGDGGFLVRARIPAGSSS